MAENDTGVNGNIWSKWDPRGYLSEYFKELGPDALLTTEFVVRELSRFKKKPVARLLEFGCGPTIIGVIGATPYAKEIHLADYLEVNLNEIKLWLKDDPKAFDCQNLIATTLKLEDVEPSLPNILRRSKELRGKITRVLHCDAGLEAPIIGSKIKYPLIISLYCADSATTSRKVWRSYMKNMFSLLVPGGTILIAALNKSHFYTIGNKKFPSANINKADLRRVFKDNGFPYRNTRIIKSLNIKRDKFGGFSGLLFACAKKSGKMDHHGN